MGEEGICADRPTMDKGTDAGAERKMASTMQNREAWRTYLSSSSQENRDKSFLSPPSPPRITCSSSSRSTLMLYTANRALKLLP